MKEWKIRQEIYHRTSEITDYMDGTEEVTPIDQVYIVADILRYFTHEQKQIIQPAKSFAVAIIYAKLLEKYFNEDFYESLSDPCLLFGNDKYFVPYQNSKQIYDTVVLNLQHKSLFNDLESINLPQVQTTISYFKREFLLT